jgi:hypothetical protein
MTDMQFSLIMAALSLLLAQGSKTYWTNLAWCASALVWLLALVPSLIMQWTP